MGTRELILTIGAIVIFALISLSAHRSMFENKMIVWADEFDIAAFALAQQYIEEAKTKPFDEVLIGDTPSGLPYSFTTPAYLGVESGETYPNFDDVDDYDSYVDTIKTERNSFIVEITVGYVADNTPDNFLNYSTFYKKMSINILSPLLSADTVAVSYIFGYWGSVP